MKQGSSVAYDHGVRKTTFTFAHGSGRLAVAPEGINDKSIEVSSVGFLPHKRQKRSDVCGRVPLAGPRVVINGQLVAKARQLLDANAYDWTRCFQRKVAEAVSEDSSSDSDASADVVAQGTELRQALGSLDDAPFFEDPSMHCSMSPMPSSPFPFEQEEFYELGDGTIYEELESNPTACPCCRGDGLVWDDKDHEMDYCSACDGGGFA